jgi:putative SOS response-associated peptidase YedK
MCGRYTVTSTADAAAELELVVGVGALPSVAPDADPDLAASIARSPLAEHPELAELLRTPRYNVAPTQYAPVVRNRPAPWRFVEPLRWGLVPSWAEDLSVGNRMINARAETVARKPAFRDALQKRRCLVLADGFYEWLREGKQKRPHHIHRPARGLMAFAGLWDRWRAPDGTWIRSFTIITTDANARVAPLHDRMPVVLDRAAWDRWLAPPAVDGGAEVPVDELVRLLRPLPAEAVEAVEVSSLVNSPANEDPACIEPLKAVSPPAQGRLF